MDKPITKWPSDSAITLRPDGREERMSLEAMAREAREAFADILAWKEESGEAVPPHQPGVRTVYPRDEGILVLGRPVSTHQPGVYTLSPGRGWSPLRRIEPTEGLYWPGDSEPAGFGEVGLETVRWYAKRRGPISFEDAVELAKAHLSPFRPDPEAARELRDWLVARFFTRAMPGADFADSSFYRPVAPNLLPPGVALDEAFVGPCIKKAASSRPHYDALREAAAVLLRARRLDGALAGWYADSVRPAVRRGPPPWTNTLRDKAIIATIARLEAEGMTATRNEASERQESACDAVAKTLPRMSYGRVLKIWKKRRRL